MRAISVEMRDHRIDFFRGFALYMILVDHIAGDPLARLTYQHIGFSDSAEIFVYLSGLACGIAYSRTLARDGWTILIPVIAKRTARIYAYYVVSGGAAILIAMAAAGLWNINPLGAGLALPADNTATAMWQMLLLISSPAHSGVLVLYIALTLTVIPVFLISGERYALTSLAVSGTVWMLSTFLSGFARPLLQNWYFNPFAWQFLFAIGMYFGVNWDSTDPVLRRLGRLNWLLPAAWAVVAIALLYKLTLFVSLHTGLNFGWLRITPTALSSMKRNLSFLRLIHFLSVALIVATYFRSTNALLRKPIAMPFICGGMHSLQLFSLSVVLSTLANAGILAFNPSLFYRLSVDALSFAVMTLAAFAMLPSKPRRFFRGRRLARQNFPTREVNDRTC